MSGTTSLHKPEAIPGDLTESERHRLLEHGRRRRALDALGGTTTPVHLHDLARSVAACEESGDAAAGGSVERVATALHHVHLPKMDDLGVVDYDPATHLVDLNR